jgi:Fic family protein
MEISEKEQKYLRILISGETFRSSDLHARLLAEREDISLVTVKRALSDLVARGLVRVSGSGPATAYMISNLGRILTDIDADAYCAVEPDKRFGLKRYDFDLFGSVPTDIFSDDEIAMLEAATAEYDRRAEGLSPTLVKKELERLIIELSWKSSRIEGNTYTLLDTEKLILENREAAGHDPGEAKMILNHKDAFTFVRENAAEFSTVTRANLEKIHAILTKDLGVGAGLRSRLVGVVGSVYQPLDNEHQLREGLEALSDAVSRAESPYAKALLALLGISYLQPFEDGNKRTARLAANAVLLAHGCAPLSYRSVDENEYREATLVFYELHSVIPFKRIFVTQYDFAARNYAVR